MQDSGYGYPPVEDRSQRLPLLLCALAATNQNVSPEPIYALSEGAQLTDIPGNSMVLVVASDHLPKPCTDLTDTIMLPAEKLACQKESPHYSKIKFIPNSDADISPYTGVSSRSFIQPTLSIRTSRSNTSCCI